MAASLSENIKSIISFITRLFKRKKQNIGPGNRILKNKFMINKQTNNE